MLTDVFMNMKMLETPFGYFEVLMNGNNIPFSVGKGTYNTFYLDDNTPVHPDACYIARIETVNMKPGDTIEARYSVSGFEYDGGDEHTLNAVVELESYTVGIGCIDTDDLEELWKSDMHKKGADLSKFPTRHRFPYCHMGITDRRDGFEFRMVDDPKKYLCYSKMNYYSNRTVIPLSLVWNKNSDRYAWDIVSFLTC